jgi:hypothetical protein
MKKVFTWTVNVSLLCLTASALTYTMHYFIFHDSHHIFIYMVGDMGFLFIDVLLVVLFIERIISRREKRAINNKLNMVIGSFFSEVGLKFLKKFSSFIKNGESLSQKLIASPQWKKKDYAKASAATREFSYEIEMDKARLEELRDFLLARRTFLLTLMENPNLLEHESFTDLLWAVFHLTEELEYREDKLKEIPTTDYNHLNNDFKRAYSRVISAWISYLHHMKNNYPFLFSLAVRINPMDPEASPIVTG